MEIKLLGELIELLDKSDPSVRPAKEGSRLKVVQRIPNRVVTDRAEAERRLELAYYAVHDGDNRFPQAATLPATDLTSDGAKLWGYASSKVLASVKFVYWQDGHEGDAVEVAATPATVDGTAATVYATLADLAHVTTTEHPTTTPTGTTTTKPPYVDKVKYWFKVVVSDKYGVSEGQALSFVLTL